MIFRSLEGRLQLGLGISLVLLMAGVWGLGHAALQATANAFLLGRLQHDSDALVSAFSPEPSGQTQIRGRRLTPIYDQPYSGHYYALVTDRGQQLLSRSLWDWNLPIPNIQAGAPRQWRVEGPAGQHLLVWGGRYRKAGVNFTLLVAEDTSALEQELWRLYWLVAGVALGGIVLMLLTQRLVLHRAFRQLQPVYSDIERLEKGDAISLTETVPAEVLPLVQKLNRLLNHYGQRLERTRRATGNLAHALKAPLSLMTQWLERKDPGLNPQLATEFKTQIENIQRLMERELKRARYAGTGGPGQRFDAFEELPTLTRLLEQIHAHKGVHILYGVDLAQELPIDREDMLELLGNLLDNACKWARSQVIYSLSTGEQGLLILVEDDGPGCSEEELANITTRGTRLDESTHGHGLGLSIVRDIVDVYKGRIEFGRSERLGGFQVSILLPDDPPAES